MFEAGRAGAPAGEVVEGAAERVEAARDAGLGLWFKQGKAFARTGMFTNILSLYGAQAAHQLLTLLTIPYLARVLGPPGWGRLALAQSLAMFVQLVVNYGFIYSATRDVTRFREDRGELGKVVSAVMAAQSVLAAAAALGAWAVAWLWVPPLREHPLLLGMAILVGVSAGVMPMWYFQGHEQMGKFASLDIGGKLLTAMGVFAFVRTPDDDWKMLATQGAASLALLGLASYRILGHVKVRVVSFRQAVDSLRSSFDLFLYTGLASTLTIGNVFLLGLFATPTVVGYYGGAEKLSRALVGFLWPLHQAVFPRVSSLCHQDRAAGARMVVKSLAVMGSAGVVMGVSSLIFAPQFIGWILGPKFLPAVGAMRILAVLTMVLPVNIVLGLQWLLPTGLDRPYSRAVLSALVFNVVMACVLAPRFGHWGMAWAVAGTELFLLGRVVWIIRKHRVSLLRLAGVGEWGAGLRQWWAAR